MNAGGRREIAARLRGLFAGQDQGGIAEIASRLGVEEVSLRMSVDENSPFPTVDVLLAVVATYGVDPNWLLTGTYDIETHRTVLQNNSEVVGEVVRKLALGTGPISHHTDEPRRFPLVEPKDPSRSSN